MTPTGGQAERAPTRAGPKLLEIIVLVIILAVGAALRVAYLVEIRHDPGLEYPPVDGAFILHWARGLATGDWSLPPDANGRDLRIRETAFQRPPGYPYVLAGLYRLTGGAPLPIRALQMLGGLAAAALAWRLGRRLLSPAVGLVWAGFIAVHWGFIYFEAGLNGTWLVVPLLLGLFAVLLNLVRLARSSDAMLAGVLVGLTALVRPAALLLGPVLGLWLLVSVGRRHGIRRAVVSLGAALVVGGLTLLPSTVRNFRVSGHFVPISANAGVTLYHGNNPSATGFSTAAVGEAGLYSSPWHAADLMARTSGRSGRGRDFVEMSREIGREARAWMREHPRDALRLVAVRALLFWGPLEIAHSSPVAADRMASPLLRRLPFSFALALAGSLWGVGLLVLGRRQGSVGLPDGSVEVLIAMGLVVAGWFVSFLPFFVTSLYRAPVVPVLLFAAAAGAVETARLARSARPLAAAAVATLAVLWLVLSLPLIPVAPGIAERHVQRGAQWRFKGELRLAEQELRSALAVAPGSKAAAAGLAAVLLDDGRAAEAIHLLESAIGFGSVDPLLYFNLGLARSREGDWWAAATSFGAAAELAPNLVEAQLLLGTSSERVGDLGAAERAYERVLDLDPNRLEAVNNLAWLLATAPDADLRDGDRAVELARRGVSARRNASTLDTLAAAFAEAGRFDDAIAAIEEAIRANLAAPLVSAADLGRRLELFRGCRPYRQGGPVEGAEPSAGIAKR